MTAMLRDCAGSAGVHTPGRAGSTPAPAIFPAAPGDLRTLDQVLELARLAGMPLEFGHPDTEVLTMLASWCGVERTRELIEAGEIFAAPLPIEICNHPHLRVLREA